jgi:hypothetical protein
VTGTSEEGLQTVRGLNRPAVLVFIARLQMKDNCTEFRGLLRDLQTSEVAIPKARIILDGKAYNRIGPFQLWGRKVHLMR